MGLVLQYVQEPKGDRGIYRYRRRVPTDLKPFIGKRELIASLGQSKPEALKRYPAIHAAFERELEIASNALAKEKRKQFPNDRTRLERYDELMDEIRALGIDSPETAAQDEDEATMREIIAESIAARYPEDPETGHPLITNADDALRVQALMGVAPPKPAPTLEDAKRVYVAEKLDGTDFEFRKKLRRVERIVEAVNTALDPVPTLDRWTRETAKKVRDHYIAAGLKPASVKRELATLKGMITCYTASSARDIPLVGDALKAAREALDLAGDGPHVFDRYIKPTGPTTASAVLMKRIREVTNQPKHTVHSLRHGMADRLALAETSAIDKNAIMGHLNPGTGERHYGGRYAKLKVLTRVMCKAFGLTVE